MAHNFKITIPGAQYVSKYGNDANPGTQLSPKATIGAALAAGVVIIGAGVYRESLNVGSRRLVGDGVVVIRPASNTSSHPISFIVNTTFTCENIIFEDCFFSVGGASTSTLVSSRCTFKNCSFNPAGFWANNFNCLNTKFINVTQLNAAGGGGLLFTNCQIINSSFLAPNSTFNIRNTDIDITSIIRTNVAASPTFLNSTNFVNNNWRGVLRRASDDYRFKRNSTGAIISPDPGGLEPEGTLGTNLYVVPGGLNNFNQDPELVNAGIGDYDTVLSTSPNIGAAIGESNSNGNIGNVFAGSSVTTATVGLTLNNITTADNVFQITNDANIGVITSPPIQVATTLRTINRVNWNVLYRFLRGAAIASPDNSNVLLAIEQAVGTGTNPERLTFEMRWSKNTTAPVSDSDYDNNGFTPAGTWVLFEIQSLFPPLVDGTGKGDGDPLFSNTSAGRISARWVQLRITMRPGIRV